MARIEFTVDYSSDSESEWEETIQPSDQLKIQDNLTTISTRSGTAARRKKRKKVREKKKEQGKTKTQKTKKSQPTKEQRYARKGNYCGIVDATTPLNIQSHLLYKLRKIEQKGVIKWITEITPTLEKHRLKIPPTPFVIPCSFSTPDNTLPKFWVIHLPDFFSQQDSDKTVNAYWYAMEASPKQTIPTSETRHQHLTNPNPDYLSMGDHSDETILSAMLVLHIGAWRKSSKEAFVTAETRQKGNPEACYRLLRFCAIVAKYLMKKAVQVLKVIDLDTWNVHMSYAAKEKIDTSSIQEALERLAEDKLNPFLLKLASFLAVTMMTGENFHVDFGDSTECYTMIIPLGEWEDGGVLEIPTLGFYHHLGPRSLTFFQSRLLPHRVTKPKSGERLSITLATCQKAVHKVLGKKLENM